MLNITYEDKIYEILPIELNTINDEEYLVGAYENRLGSINIINIKVRDIKFNNPIYIDNYIDTYNIYYRNSSYLEGEIGQINDTYNIDSIIVLNHDAPIKEIKKTAEEKFSEVKVIRRQISKEQYKAISFRGDSLEIAKFVLSIYHHIRKVEDKATIERIQDVLGILYKY